MLAIFVDVYNLWIFGNRSFKNPGEVNAGDICRGSRKAGVLCRAGHCVLQNCGSMADTTVPAFLPYSAASIGFSFADPWVG